MTDDSNSRYRSSDPYGRGPAPAVPANDPLAELARLIGQNDPFSEHGRDSGVPAPRDGYYNSEPAPYYGSNPAQPTDPAPYYNNEPAPHYGSNSHSDPAPYYGNDPAPQYNNDYARPYASDAPPQNNWQSAPAPANTYSDPFALPRPTPMPGDQHFEPGPAFAEPRVQAAPASYNPSYEPAPYQPPPDEQTFQQPTYPREPENGPMPAPHHDEFYDDAPRSGRRKGLLTIMAVLGLAVLGTAGAFAYRSMFGGASSGVNPPVIRASGEPSKVAPPPAAVNSSNNKISYDRFGDRGQNEQVVAREEQPLDPKDLARSSAARSALPGSATTSVAPSSAPATGNPPSVLGEPRRVRTVPIRPDQPDAPQRPQMGAPAPAAVAPQRQTALVAPANPPLDVAPAQAPPPASTRMATAPRTTARAAPQQTSPSGGNAPLSLSPDNSSALPPPASREAAAPVRAAPPAPIRTASATAGGGGYLVQVSSQKSEADAQTSYRSIQSKYSNVLNSHQHIVRRADLGSKGVYYRAMVGPFGTREQAIQLCSSLKAAGGDCVVQAN